VPEYCRATGRTRALLQKPCLEDDQHASPRTRYSERRHHDHTTYRRSRHPPPCHQQTGRRRLSTGDDSRTFQLRCKPRSRVRRHDHRVGYSNAETGSLSRNAVSTGHYPRSKNSGAQSPTPLAVATSRATPSTWADQTIFLRKYHIGGHAHSLERRSTNRHAEPSRLMTRPISTSDSIATSTSHRPADQSRSSGPHRTLSRRPTCFGQQKDLSPIRMYLRMFRPASRRSRGLQRWMRRFSGRGVRRPRERLPCVRRLRRR